MQKFWALLFWAVTVCLAWNSLMIMKERHPGYATGLAVIMCVSFVFAIFKDKK